jgi:hypothetical protein
MPLIKPDGCSKGAAQPRILDSPKVTSEQGSLAVGRHDGLADLDARYGLTAPILLPSICRPKSMTAARSAGALVIANLRRANPVADLLAVPPVTRKLVAH